MGKLNHWFAMVPHFDAYPNIRDAIAQCIRDIVRFCRNNHFIRFFNWILIVSYEKDRRTF